MGHRARAQVKGHWTKSQVPKVPGLEGFHCTTLSTQIYLTAHTLYAIIGLGLCSVFFRHEALPKEASHYSVVCQTIVTNGCISAYFRYRLKKNCEYVMNESMNNLNINIGLAAMVPTVYRLRRGHCVYHVELYNQNVVQRILGAQSFTSGEFAITISSPDYH